MQQAVETIWRNAKAQAQIVDDILDVSRIITGNLYLDLHPLEVVPVGRERYQRCASHG
jgi:signal transduction histidine kinase